MAEQWRLEKTVGMAFLSDFYGPLLTEKQRQALRLFYDEDLSLSEIASACACSRQAAHELIKRSEALLAEYERQLGLVAQHQQRQNLFAQAERELLALGIDRNTEKPQALWQIWQQLKSN